MNKRKDHLSIASKNIVGMRIAYLRTQRNMSQQDLANLLSELSATKETPYSVSTISSWEQGRRMPPSTVLGLLSHLFAVKEEYLRGLSDDPDSSEIKDTNKSIELKVKDLSNFDGRPVFVSFVNQKHEDQFAIVNADTKRLMMRDGYISYPNDSIRAIYVNEPDYASCMSQNGLFPLDMNGLLNTPSNLIWVEMKTSDQIVRSRYNGWYRRNENNTALISSVGYVLPFEGLHVSYNAYLKRNLNS